MILDKNNLTAITEYLQFHGLLKAHETVISAEKPGEGNMNYTLRLVLPSKTVIIKQARPYVEKYPFIPAPQERAIIEATFYQQILNDKAISKLMPALIFTDEEHYILILEDLGKANDFTFLYKKGKHLSIEESMSIGGFLSSLHQKNMKKGIDKLLKNSGLKELNHEHIFLYPLMEENSFNLDEVQKGLQNIALKFKKDKLLKSEVKKLGKEYLRTGKTLLHGDFYPGSWLKTKKGVKIIDPEFCFCGTPEFDFGVMKAHLIMAQQPAEVMEAINIMYTKSNDFDEQLLDKFTGIEIMRRLIGLAQLPLSLTLAEKEIMLDKAYKMVLF